MLNVYYGKENIPKDKPFIFDVEQLYTSINLQQDAYAERVLRVLEHAIAKDKDVFEDKYGVSMYTSDLSTSTKILLAVSQTDYVINGFELGSNGYNLLSEVDKGYILLNEYSFDFVPNRFPVSVNGRVCSNPTELELAVLGAEV